MNSQIAETVSKMPPQLQKEVEDFVLFLAKRERPRSTRKLLQNWAGALKEYRETFTSVSLQKKALEWRLE
ncbi:MAG: DUF2281 domain-containing protein [Lentisphaerae bacterium]|nr:DUF2281 domain-containing protein [Lentisphaerota bacterium]